MKIFQIWSKRSSDAISEHVKIQGACPQTSLASACFACWNALCVSITHTPWNSSIGAWPLQFCFLRVWEHVRSVIINWLIAFMFHVLLLALLDKTSFVSAVFPVNINCMGVMLYCHLTYLMTTYWTLYTFFVFLEPHRVSLLWIWKYQLYTKMSTLLVIQTSLLQ